MTIIRKYNSLLPDYLDRVFGRDHDEEYAWPLNRPAVNIIEDNDKYYIELAAPGYDKKDFKIDLDNDELKISAKKEGRNGEGYVLREFHYGDFERSFTLGEKINTIDIHASYIDGVLRVTLPKKEEAKVKPPKMIEIK